MSKVAIAKCEDYEQPHVDEALRHSLELIGGLKNFVKPGQKVIIKVNGIMSVGPEAGVTTHPSVVSSVVKEVRKLGAFPLVGDSPGNALGNIQQILEKTGIKKAAEEAGGEIFPFQVAGITELPSPSSNKLIKTLHLSKAILKADVIINLPKLKTHNLTLYTGAIKNMFGCVPGFNKSKYHLWAPRSAQFSESLVDIFQITKPKLNIMDGIVGMEGNGPSAGNKRILGAIIASADGVALDAICSAAIGYKPFTIDTTRIAHKRGLGEGRLGKIEIAGTPLSEITQKDWKHPVASYSLTRYLPRFIYSLTSPLTRFIRVNPVIIQDVCTKCMICVNNCPTKTIHYKENKVEIDLSNCIMCFCCHELCPYQAIKLERSWLVRKFGLVQKE
jgi:uncharacterized protein (DUF362 family)/Pyruvate/2-oxoacid:ferredoxin oxidoreductase delta subunit